MDTVQSIIRALLRRRHLHLHSPQKAYPSTLRIVGLGSAKLNNDKKKNGVDLTNKIYGTTVPYGS